MLSTEEPTSRMRVAAACSLGAVDVEVEDGVVVGLLEASVDDAGNLRESAARMLVGDLAIADRPVPSIWTSMGAGRPKLRICVTMSEGRK